MKKFPIALLSLCLVLVSAAHAQDRDDWQHSDIRHVILISIDGMHAVDYLNCSRGIAGVNDGEPYCPNLASLAKTGINFVNAAVKTARHVQRTVRTKRQ